MGEYLANTGVTQYALSETQKFGHVTYFWNGNKSGKFSEELETYIEIPSDVVPFEQRPWMKCAEITDKLIECLKSGEYQCLRVNFPNGDMVGHTGNLLATRCSMEALDLQLARILKVVDELHGAALIPADHGNADNAINEDGSANTAHSLNPVPIVVVSDRVAKVKDGILADVAPTVLDLMGLAKPAEMTGESLVEFK